VHRPSLLGISTLPPGTMGIPTLPPAGRKKVAYQVPTLQPLSQNQTFSAAVTRKYVPDGKVEFPKSAGW